MALKLKVRTQFPALVQVQSPLLLSKVGISYTFSLDIAAIKAIDRGDNPNRRPASDYSGCTIEMPLGLLNSLAILANSLLGATPTEQVRPVSSKMAF